jgi:hypothetical protein
LGRDFCTSRRAPLSFVRIYRHATHESSGTSEAVGPVDIPSGGRPHTDRSGGHVPRHPAFGRGGNYGSNSLVCPGNIKPRPGAKQRPEAHRASPHATPAGGL